jgi:hypothetical protein
MDTHITAFGESAVLTEGIEEKDSHRKVRDLKFEKFVTVFSSATLPQFVAQLEVEVNPEQQAPLIEHFSLGPGLV